MKNPYVIFVVFFFISLRAWAQDTTTPLEHIIVFSDRLQLPFNKQNRNIQVLSAEEIKTIPVKSVNELLAYIAGVDVRQRGPNGTQADIGIDGGTFDQTLVLLNGFKVNDPQTGHHTMNLPIPVDAIARIEVLKGAAARIYGVNALMGVINIVTKQALENDLRVRVYSGSSFQNDERNQQLYANYGAEVVGSIATPKWKHLIAGSWNQGNGYRYNTAYQNTKLLYSGQGSIGRKTALELMAGWVDNDFGASYFYAPPDDKEATERVSSFIASARLPIRLSDQWTIRPSIVYKNGYDHFVFVRQNPAIYENIHRTHTIDASLDHLFKSHIGTFALGLNVRSEAIHSTNLGKNNRINYGIFLEYRYAYREKWDARMGVYLNHNSVFGFNAYPGIDIGYHIHHNVRLYANIGIGQRLPTFTDLYYNDPANAGNPNLKPESMTSYELGFSYAGTQSHVNASLFYKQGSDFIDWVRKDPNEKWNVENFSRLQSFGFHLDANHRWQWKQHRFAAYTSYTYLCPSIRHPNASLYSRYVINTLQHQWTARLHWQLHDGLSVGINSRLQYRLNAGNEQEGNAKKIYQLTDVKVSYRFHHFTLDVEVNNVFNVKYIELGVVPLPGIWTTLGLNYRLK